MALQRITVFLPCHGLDDFPTWLDESEADAVLAAWTAAWHPALIAAAGCLPSWASVDVPPVDSDPLLGIVPSAWDDRFESWAGQAAAGGSRFVRRLADRDAIVSACLGGDPQSTVPFTADFHALGLAWLLGELLARRMRSSSGLESSGFRESVLAAARAAEAGDHDAARTGLRESFDCLESSRSHYYPVDVWLIDLVLLAESTLGRSLAAELESPVPAGLVATGEVIAALAVRNPEMLARVRRRCQAGMLAAVGGRHDSRPIGEHAPETIVESFARGRRAWREHVGAEPATHAQCAGGSSAILPQVLRRFGYAGAVWHLFDGTPLPDPGAGRIRWEGTGGASIDAVARPPLDARSARTIIALADTIGDAMDHDHTVVLQFAHHAGTASRWFHELRRIGGWSHVLGTFATPDEVFRRTAGAGSLVAFEPDVFPVPPVPHAAEPRGPDDATDLVGDHIVAASEEARRLLESRRTLDDVIAGDADRRPGDAPPVAADHSAPRRSSLWRSLTGGFFASGGGADDELVLQNEAIRVQVQRATGGLLSVRRPGGGNLLSQRLSWRNTRPRPAPGEAWESAEERAGHSAMVADRIKREASARGRGDSIVSHGRLVGHGDRAVGSFTQRVSLVGDMPLAMVDIDVRFDAASAGPFFEEHAACRFAWNENADVEIRRSLHTQSIVTERTRIPASHFIELSRQGRLGGAAEADRVVILTGGLPWHVRSGPHMLDSILLAGPARQARRRIALGVGVERPWDAALRLLAGVPLECGPPAGPANVRFTAGPVVCENGRVVAARVGLLETAGRAGAVSIAWAADVERVRPCDAAGMPLDEDIAGGDARTTTIHLAAYQWLHLDVRFRDVGSAARAPAP